MKVEVEVDKCVNCPLFGFSSDGMQCNHTFWENKGAYDSMIITQDNKNNIPEKCPLRLEKFTKIVMLK